MSKNTVEKKTQEADRPAKATTPPVEVRGRGDDMADRKFEFDADHSGAVVKWSQKYALTYERGQGGRIALVTTRCSEEDYKEAFAMIQFVGDVLGCPCLVNVATPRRTSASRKSR